MAGEIYKRINYSADISYLLNSFICEYDLSKANINILYSKGVLDKDTYDWLYNAKRMVRQKYIGKLQQQNGEVIRILQAGIVEAKKMLFEANDIQDSDVLMIKNDAVFTINRNLETTQFGDYIKFNKKNEYTSYFKIDKSNLELLYYYSNYDKSEALDVKGISDENLKYHKEFLQILKDIFYTLQIDGVGATIGMMKDIYSKYVSLSFPVEYYRAFNSKSLYHILIGSMGTGYDSNSATEEMKRLLDISYNADVLRSIQKIIFNIYFNK